MIITCNGCPVVISLSYVTEPGEGWTGEEFIGEYEDMESLTRAINKHRDDVRVGWQLKVDFQDKERYQVTTEDVRLLRSLSGEGMMSCKKALEACDGDMEKAKDYLRKVGNISLVYQ